MQKGEVGHRLLLSLPCLRACQIAAKNRGAKCTKLTARQDSQPVSRGSQKPPWLWTGSMHFLLTSSSPVQGIAFNSPSGRGASGTAFHSVPTTICACRAGKSTWCWRRSGPDRRRSPHLKPAVLDTAQFPIAYRSTSRPKPIWMASFAWAVHAA